jgi:hypothetical protein
MVNFHPRQTSPGLLQWFREVVDKQGVHVQVFIDPETDLELGIFLPTATIKQRIEKALPQEQPVRDKQVNNNSKGHHCRNCCSRRRHWGWHNRATSHVGRASLLVFAKRTGAT